LPDLIGNGVAVFLAWLMGQAALHKLRSPLYYQGLVKQYLPLDGMAKPLVLMGGLVELLVALALLVPVSRKLALAAAAAMLLAYALMMARQWLQGERNTRCGCAGPGSSLNISPALVLRNLICSALAGAAITPVATAAPILLAWVVSLLVAAFLVVVYLCAEQLIANSQLMAEAR